MKILKAKGKMLKDRGFISALSLQPSAFLQMQGLIKGVPAFGGFPARPTTPTQGNKE